MSVVIGITGGVGSGKSEIAGYLQSEYGMYLVKADDLGHIVIEPGGRCYDAIVSLLGERILKEDKTIDRRIMADIIFSDAHLKSMVNSIIHPVVKEMAIEDIGVSEDAGYKGIVLEAALMIEAGYDDLVDELWYIYASEDTRRERLKMTRGYSDAKIDAIMQDQLSEQVYEEYCDLLIDNDGDWENTRDQIDRLLKENTK